MEFPIILFAPSLKLSFVATLLLLLWQKNVFYKMLAYILKELKFCFQNRKWNYLNRKLANVLLFKTLVGGPGKVDKKINTKPQTGNSEFMISIPYHEYISGTSLLSYPPLINGPVHQYEICLFQNNIWTWWVYFQGVPKKRGISKCYSVCFTVHLMWNLFFSSFGNLNSYVRCKYKTISQWYQGTEKYTYTLNRFVCS